MRLGRYEAFAILASFIVILTLSSNFAHARPAPVADKTHTIPAIARQLGPALKPAQWQAMKFASPALPLRIIRFAGLTQQPHVLKNTALKTPDRRLPSVRELAGAPEHVPVRLNASPDHSLQSLKDLMPEADPYLLKAHDLNRQTGCLALAIYYEARSEDTLGQIAVAQVIFNRVRSTKYPNSICRVVYQNAHRANRCQFSFACDGRTERPRHKQAWAAAMRLARTLNCIKACRSHPHGLHPFLRLSEDLRKATHYHADYVEPGWSRKLIRSGKIGRHIFYISKRVWS